MKQLYVAGRLAPPPSAQSPDEPLLLAPAGHAATLRAATTGLRPDELQLALGFANYAPPPGRAPETDRPLPVRLALLNTPTAGRVLTHVTPNGGTYFAHTLLDVPATADAQLAIQTWGSPMWQRHEPLSGNDLPDLPYLPVADVLDDAALKDWLDAPARRDLLEFVLTALLGTPPTTRIVLGVSAEDVAKVVYAVTRALPTGLLDDFTFSTYETDPLACPARLVGHETGSAEWDLPAACFLGQNVAFNPASGRKSDLPAEVPFARFAVTALSGGDCAQLDDLKATWQRLGLRDARQFDLVFRLARGTGVLTKDEAAEAMRHTPLVAWISGRADAMNQFLEWALDDRAFATASLSRAVQAVRQKGDVIGRLGQTVRERGLQALKDGDHTRTANALEVILPMVAPAKANAVWGELIGQITNPDVLPWAMRWYLLPRFVRFKQLGGGTGVDPSLGTWLDVPADHLGEVLALDLPRAYHLAAAEACLKRDGEPSALFTRTLAAHPALALTLLRPTADSPTDTDRREKLFASLLAEAPGHPWFEEILNHAADYPPALRNTFFETVLTGGNVDADRLIRGQGPRLLDLFAGQSGLDRLGAQFLAAPPTDLLDTPAVLDFLGKLKDEACVSDGVKARVAAIQAVRGYLDAPTFDADAMTPVADALTTPAVVPPRTRGEVFAAVSRTLTARSEADTFQADLESALVHLGGVIANDPADLYENLLRDVRTRTEFLRHPNMVSGFLAVALGAARSPALAGRLDGLDVQAFAVATEAANRGGKKLLRDLDRRTESWPKPARTQWGFLLAAVEPRGFKGFLRDAGLFLAGAAAASAVWGVLKVVG